MSSYSETNQIVFSIFWLKAVDFNLFPVTAPPERVEAYRHVTISAYNSIIYIFIFLKMESTIR